MSSTSSPQPQEQQQQQQVNESLNIETPESSLTPEHGMKSKLLQLYSDYEFFLILLITVPLAKAYPILGSSYLRPEITSSWIAIMYIFRKFYTEGLARNNSKPFSHVTVEK
jgi:hypothetical protein